MHLVVLLVLGRNPTVAGIIYNEQRVRSVMLPEKFSQGVLNFPLGLTSLVAFENCPADMEPVIFFKNSLEVANLQYSC